MYISEATHEAICQSILAVISAFLAFAVIAFAISWIKRRREIIGLRIKILSESILIALAKVLLKVVRLLLRITETAQRRRDKRRYRSAMRVFDRPLQNWSEK